MKTTLAPNISKAPDVNSCTFCWRARPGCPPALRAQPLLRKESRDPGMAWKRTGGGSSPSLECGITQTQAELSGHILRTLLCPMEAFGVCHPVPPPVPTCPSVPQAGLSLSTAPEAVPRTCCPCQPRAGLLGQLQGDRKSVV